MRAKVAARGREAAAIAIGALLVVVGALLPEVRGAAFVVLVLWVVAAVAGLRALDRRTSPDAGSAVAIPAAHAGFPAPPLVFVGAAQITAADDLTQRLLQPGVVAVSGESGIGKSTLVAAAANKPRIRVSKRERIWLSAKGIDTGAEVEVLVAEALEAPSLARALAGFEDLAPIVVIDDLELLLRSSPTEAAQFIDQLAAGTRQHGTFVLIAQGNPTWPASVDTVVQPQLLDPRGADELFAEWAPNWAADQRRLTLLAYVGGAPRAIELLAKTAARCADLATLLDAVKVDLLADGPGMTRQVNLAVAVDLVLSVAKDDQVLLLERLNQFPDGLAVDDAPLVFSDLPAVGLHLGDLYALGLVRNTGAGVQVATVVGHRLGETRPGPPSAVRDTDRGRFVEIAHRRAGAADDTDAAWYAANAGNIDAACLGRWPGAEGLAGALVSSPWRVSPTVLALAAEAGDDDLARHLTERLAGSTGWSWARQADAFGVVVAIFRRLGDRLAEADALRELGRLSMRSEALEMAATTLTDALAIYREASDRLGEANTLVELGRLAIRRDQLDEADAHLTDAQHIYRELHNRLGEANTLHHLGRLAMRRDQLDEAKAHLTDAQHIYRELPDRLGEANILVELGRLAIRRDQVEEADTHLTKAADIYRELNNRLGEADTLIELGRLAIRRSQLRMADEHLTDAFVIYRAIDDRLGEANTIHELGRLAIRRDQLRIADKHLTDALVIYRAIDDQLGEANSFHDLGQLAIQRNRLTEAEAHLTDAVALYRAIEDRLGEANALHDLGQLAIQRNQPTEAEAHLTDAVAIYRAIPNPLGEANTLIELGRLAIQRNQPTEAEAHLTDAVAIYRAIEDRLGEANTLYELGRLRHAEGDLEGARAQNQAARTCYASIDQRAPWLDNSDRAIDRALHLRAEGADHLQHARASGSEAEAIEAYRCFDAAGLAKDAATVAEEFGLDVV